MDAESVKTTIEEEEEALIGSALNITELEAMRLSELREMAKECEISGYSRLKKQDLILRLLRAKAEKMGHIFGGGILEIVSEGIGFLRADHLLPGPDDVYVSNPRSVASGCALGIWSSARSVLLRRRRNISVSYGWRR